MLRTINERKASGALPAGNPLSEPIKDDFVWQSVRLPVECGDIFFSLSMLMCEKAVLFAPPWFIHLVLERWMSVIFKNLSGAII